MNNTYKIQSKINWVMAFIVLLSFNTALQAQSLDYVVDQPYDISIASFNSSVLDVSAQESRPFAMLFNDDGSKLYVTGWDNNNINQYDLTSAFDVSTATFNQVAFVESNTGLHHIQTLQYNGDGSKLYVLVSDGFIWQYLLTTAYDIATAQPIEFFPYANILAIDTIDMVYNGDGTILYVMHPTAKDIKQYNLSTAYDIRTASEVGTVITFAGIISIPTSMVFNADGSKLYVADGSPNTIHQFDVTTAYDLTSASYGQISLDLTTTAITPLAIIFNNDGSKLYVSDSVSSTINQFDINQTIYAETLSNNGSVDNSNPLIINLVGDSFSTSSAALPVGQYSVGNVPSGLIPVLNIDSSGTQAVLSLTGNAINHQDINDINDLSFSFTDAAFIGGDAANIVNSGINSAYSTNTAVDFLDEYRLDYILTPELDLTSAVYSGTAIDSVLASGIPYDMIFNNDGTVLYLLGPSLRNISQYNLMRAYDISTALYVGEVLNIFDQDYQPVSMIFSNDGYKLYILGVSGLDVNQYDLSNAYDISTATFNAVVMNVDAQGTSPRSMLFNNDGTQLYIITNSNLGNISQYNMTIPYDISTASFNQTALNVAEQETRPQSIFFNHDGSKLYVMGYQGDDVNQYNLTIAYDISSAVFDRVAFRFPGQELDPTSMIFNGDGSTLYIAGSNKTIEQYDLSPTIYQETVTNDGTINNTRSLSIKLNNSTFTSSGTALPTNQYSITGMPNGLSAVLYIDPTATTATLAFTGATLDHQNLNDIVANLSFSFTDAAFSNNNANNIVNSGSITPFLQDIEFDFNDNITMTYTPGQYDENSSNIGMIDNTTPLTINLAGDITTGYFTTSSGVLPSSLYTIGRVPAGLTPILTIDSTGTLATLTFSGTATSHQISNNVIDFPFRFHDAAFTNNDAKIIVNSGFGVNIYIAAARIDFIDNPRLAYALAAASYPEALTNDGSIDNSNPIVITSIGETFSVNSVDLPSTQYSIGNLPAGLTAVLTIDNSATQATLTLTGNAISHQNFHDVSDLTFTFTDDAFTNGNASVVLNSGFFSAFSSNIGIDFADNAGFPVAVDDNYTVKVDGNLILFPLTGDTDPDGDTLSVISLNGVALTGSSNQSIAVPNGVVTVFLGSSFQFIPDANFIGTVIFPYTITDNNGGTAIANQIIRIDVFSAIGGTITGLNGGVSIKLNDIENASLNGNGTYNFFNQLINGSSYLVTINTQPTSPNQTCVLANASGTVTGTDITNVDITCTTNSYFIGGSVTGLINDNSMVLQNNLSNDLQLCNQSTFVFSMPLLDQSPYDITILTSANNPTQSCSVVNGSSTLAGDDVTTVEISCANDGEIIYRNSFEEGCPTQ
jgi:sugar lactone lactonase YvrE